MARSPDEKARFRGNDELYKQNWDHIFNKKKELNEEAQVGNETGSDGACDAERGSGGHPDENVDRSCSDDAKRRRALLHVY